MNNFTKRGRAFFGCLALSLLAAACQDAPLAIVDTELDDAAVDAVDQPNVRFNDVNFVKSPSLVSRLDGQVFNLSSFSHSINVVGVGSNSGNASAAQIFSSGDLTGTFSTIGFAAFNALSVEDLRAAYDVLIFTWVSTNAINADWNTRLLPYMALGGGIVFEDPGNIGDLAPGVSASGLGGGSSTVTAVVPGLTDGIVSSFVNNHIRFNAWDPALSPFLQLGSAVTGLWGQFGSGCIVLTGPDQHFHGFRGAGNPAGNQYNLLLNEVDFVAHSCGNPVEIDIKPGSDPSSYGCGAGGNIPVAVLGSEVFDATTIDAGTVRFGKIGNETGEVHEKKGEAKRHVEDFNEDGFADMIFHFDFSSTGFSCDDIPAGEKSVTLDGTLTGIAGGDPFSASSDIRLVGGN